MSGERLKILLSGMVAGDPGQGGATWAVLQYVAGLRGLGHEVLLVEPVAAASLDRASRVARYFRSLAPLAGRAALLAREGTETMGLPYRTIERFAREADLLLNVSGMLRDERLLEPIPVRAFLDLDPGFNQVWAAQGFDFGLDRHTHCATVGVRLGAADCPVPTLGRTWIPTLPPVALPSWPLAAGAGEAWTSVGNWRSYGSPGHDGVRYGQRAHSLRELIELPRRSNARFELALGIHPDERADLEALAANGWGLVDPLAVAGTPAAYADFVRRSRAELGVAKQGYVVSRSGWFSDRSACYLASGRPVVAQDTGFGAALPTGTGLLAFDDVAGAAAAVEVVEADLERHRRAAREIAGEHLDAARVLPALLERLAVPEPRAVIVSRRRSPYRTSFPIEELELELPGVGRSKTICKSLDWEELDATARLAKPRFLHDPRREPCVYERLLPRGPAGPPRFRCTALEAGRRLLFLEWVDGRNLFQVGERQLWEEAAGWLGRFHAAFTDPPADLLGACPLLERDAGFHRRWLARAREFGAVPAGADGSALASLAAKHELVVGALLAMPQTLLHGEFYASNVLVDGGGGRPARVAPVDWELAGPGPGALDLAALVCGWPAADREAMRRAYERGLGAELLATDLDLARLQTAIQWLGWAPPQWQPPPDQRRDWAAEAIEIAEGLEL